MEFTFLTASQTLDFNKIKQEREELLQSEITDFSKFLGGNSLLTNDISSSMKGKWRRKHMGIWATKTITQKNATVICIDWKGQFIYPSVYNKCLGARPVIEYSSIKYLASDLITDENNVKKVEYGEYPQTVENKEIEQILEQLYLNNNLNKTGKTYTTESYITEKKFDIKVKHCKHVEYEYDSKKYIRLIGNCNCEYKELSDNRYINKGKTYWIKVEPIVWLIDEKLNIAITEKIIFSGVKFTEQHPCRDNFNRTNIYKFMNKFFAKDIIPSNLRKLDNRSRITRINTFDKKIQLLLIKINKYLVNVQNKEEIKNNVNKLLDDYNTKLNSLENNQGLLLYSEEFLQKELIIKLDMIIDKLELCSKYTSIYYEILNKIKFVNNIIIGKKVDIENDDLIKDFNTINNCLSFLKEEDKKKITEDILNILSTEETKIINYLRSIEPFNDNFNTEENSINYSNYQEFELILRNKLQPILINLNKNVLKRNIELDMVESLKKMKQNLYEDSEKNILSVYLNEINRLKLEIEGLLTKLDISNRINYLTKLQQITFVDIDYNQDLIKIIKSLTEIIISLHKLNYNITEQLNTINKRNKNYIKVRLK